LQKEIERWVMRKKLTLSIDDDVYEGLLEVPRKFSVSDFVSFMLRGMLQEFKKGRIFNEEEFEKWINSDPELKRIREGIREAWGPTVWKAADKVINAKKKVKGTIKKVLGTWGQPLKSDNIPKCASWKR
jgi:predicted CopG family antitoxin